MRCENRITASKLAVEMFVATIYMFGSALFVIGSVYFLPNIFKVWSVTMFVYGSVLFQMATLAPVVLSCARWCKKRKRQQTKMLAAKGNYLRHDD